MSAPVLHVIACAHGTHDAAGRVVIDGLRADLAALLDAGVKYAFSAFVDLHGRPKGKCVPVDHLDQMLQGSELYTGASLDGVPQNISDDEVAAMPVLARLRRLAWMLVVVPRFSWTRIRLTPSAQGAAIGRLLRNRSRSCGWAWISGLGPTLPRVFFSGPSL